uniref:Uncharacterized protein n=1 Tax=Rhizobium leguminosarum bv. trifolii TaxID=386 RepID=A0A1C9I3I6_RHILT|nr:hypothetical protein [Rhizobium leguminosarum bv. trifolii]
MIRSIADHEPHLMSLALAAVINARRTGSNHKQPGSFDRGTC